MAFERNRSGERGGLDTPISGSIRVQEEDLLARTLQMTEISAPVSHDPGPLPAFTPHFRQGASVRPRLFLLRKT